LDFIESAGRKTLNQIIGIMIV